MIQALVQSLYGAYVATGAYSFEFRTSEGAKISEIFFVFPPEKVDYVEPQRTSLAKTIGGGYLADFGNDFKQLTITGSLNYFIYGKPGAPLKGGVKPADGVSGFIEFQRLRWALHRYRDYTLSPGGRLVAPTFSVPGTTGANAITKFSKRRNALADAVDVIWHDYDNDSHYYCYVEEIRHGQGIEDVQSTTYSIPVQLFEPFTRGRARKYVKTKKKKKKPIEQIQNASQFFNDQAPESKPSTMPQSASGGLLQQPALPNLTTDGEANTAPNFVGYDSSNLGGIPSTAIVSDKTPAALKVAQLAAKNQQLRILRGKILGAASNVSTGLKSAKKEFKDLLSKFNTLYLEIKKDFEFSVIPEGSLADFAAGTSALSEFASPDQISYYLGLISLRIAVNGIQVGINEIGESPPQNSFNPSLQDGVLASISTDDYDSENNGLPGSIETTPAYDFYELQENDTLPSIALRLYGDAARYVEIARANQITDNTLLDQVVAGQFLRIPVQQSKAIVLDDNLVYSGPFNGITQDEFNKYLYGVDLALSKDGGIAVSPTGDWGIVDGAPNVRDALNLRFDTDKGALNYLHPDYGVDKIADDGSLPPLVALENYLSDREGQALQDPRIAAAVIDRSNVKIYGDSFSATMRIEIAGGGPPIEVPIDGSV